MKSLPLVLMVLLSSSLVGQEGNGNPEPSPLHPENPRVRKMGDVWEVRLQVKANLPAGTVVRARLVPLVLRFEEDGRMLRWAEVRQAPRARRSLVKGRWVEFRMKQPKLGRVRIAYSVQGRGGDGSAGLRQDTVLGTVAGRLRGLRTGLKEARRGEKQMRKLLEKMKELEVSGSVEKGGGKLSVSMNRLQGRFLRMNRETAYTAAIGLMDSLLQSAIGELAVQIWVAKGEEGGDAEARALDGAANDETEEGSAVAGKLLKRAGVAQTLLRLEAFQVLLFEFDRVLDRALRTDRCDPREAEALEKTLGFLGKEHGDAAPADTVELLREILEEISRFKTAGPEEKESLKSYRTLVRAQQSLLSRVLR